MDRKTDEYADQPIEETLKALGSDASHGLSDSVAQERLEQVGYNEIQEKEASLWHRIFRRFWGPIPWMIEIAAILALKALKQGLAGEATVLREGEYKTVPFRELVSGDVIRIKIGNVIPADVQLLDGDYLLIDQAALTGESLPVSKKTSDVAYANTIVKQGEMLAVVVNTGMRTNFSSVVSLVSSAGLIPLYDPPREDSKDVIAEMQRNGVEVKMVTGAKPAVFEADCCRPQYPLWIWGYALVWFLVTDAIKVLTYRMLRHEGTVE